MRRAISRVDRAATDKRREEGCMMHERTYEHARRVPDAGRHLAMRDARPRTTSPRYRTSRAKRQAPPRFSRRSCEANGFARPPSQGANGLKYPSFSRATVRVGVGKITSPHANPTRLTGRRFRAAARTVTRCETRITRAPYAILQAVAGIPSTNSRLPHRIKSNLRPFAERSAISTAHSAVSRADSTLQPGQSVRPRGHLA